MEGGEGRKEPLKWVHICKSHTFFKKHLNINQKKEDIWVTL